MNPTKILPYIVLVKEANEPILVYAFHTLKQAERFMKGVQVGTNFKVAMYISIKKAKRGDK